MDTDLKEQISDLKSFLRTVADALEKHLRSTGDVEEADYVKKWLMEHLEYRTKRLVRLCAEARDIINKASDCEGGPHIEDLEHKAGWNLPGRGVKKPVAEEQTKFARDLPEAEQSVEYWKERATLEEEERQIAERERNEFRQKCATKDAVLQGLSVSNAAIEKHAENVERERDALLGAQVAERGLRKRAEDKLHDLVTGEQAEAIQGEAAWRERALVSERALDTVHAELFAIKTSTGYPSPGVIIRSDEIEDRLAAAEKRAEEAERGRDELKAVLTEVADALHEKDWGHVAAAIYTFRALPVTEADVKWAQGEMKEAKTRSAALCPQCGRGVSPGQRCNACNHSPGQVICPALLAHKLGHDIDIAACQTCKLRQGSNADASEQIANLTAKLAAVMGAMEREIQEAEGCDPAVENGDCLYRGDRDCHHCYTCRTLTDEPSASKRLRAIVEAAEAKAEMHQRQVDFRNADPQREHKEGPCPCGICEAVRALKEKE